MKKPYQLALLFLAITALSCNSKHSKSNSSKQPSQNDLTIVGAMKNVMWKGELGPSINLDTVSNTKGLYGLGPESYLRGELLINNGKSYVSKVTSDSTMIVQQRFDISAPFFVYANITKWSTIKVPQQIKDIKDLERFIIDTTKMYKKPFGFTLSGTVSNATIHIQNLPKGMTVSSPQEAHQGQVNYNLQNKAVDIVGFFSREHQGVFTHHDSYVHMHLITKDETQMGHLDALEIENMTLYLPKK